MLATATSNCDVTNVTYGAPFVKILYLTDLAQKPWGAVRKNNISDRFCTKTAISARIQLSQRIFSRLCSEIAISVHI